MVVPASLFSDARFGAPTEAIGAQGLFDLDDAMRRFLAVDLGPAIRSEGRHNGLVNALYRRDVLQLKYDASKTRNAAATFAARSGNCLSLVIMTAAFAKHLGLDIDYRSAVIDDTWSHRGVLYVASGHVNITVSRRLIDREQGTGKPAAVSIDFLPPEDLLGLRTVAIDESTVIAMYLNNRAAEALAQSRLDDAYAWARAAIRQAPGFPTAFNTLGAVYREHGDLALAIAAFREDLLRSPEHLSAMANLAQALAANGQQAEAAVWSQRLAALEAYPPFHDLHQGRLAMERGDWRAANASFKRELKRSGSSADLHHLLAVAALRLGDVAEARHQLSLAVDTSSTRGDEARYAAKLDHLGASGGAH